MANKQRRSDNEVLIALTKFTMKNCVRLDYIHLELYNIIVRSEVHYNKV